MDLAEHDVLAHMTFLREHRAMLHPNPIECLPAKIKRRSNFFGTLPI